MNNREIAMEFLRCFCAGDVAGLVPLFAEDLRFKGPYHQFFSSAAYLESLKSDPPEKSSYRVLSVSEGNDSVSVFWDYEKNDRTVTIAQLFRFRDQAISEILLVFDGRESA